MSDFRNQIAERLIVAHVEATAAYSNALSSHPGKIGLHEELRFRLKDIDLAMANLVTKKRNDT